MPRLKNDLVLPALFRPLNQIVGFLQARRQRLLHQQVQPRIQQRRRHRMMMHRGHGNRSRIQLQIRREQLVDGREDRNPILGLGIGGPRRVRLHGRNKRNAQPAVSSSRYTRRWLRPNAPAPATATRKMSSACYLATPVSGFLPSTAFRQRP